MTARDLRRARLDESVRRERARRERGERERRISVGHYIATAGALGWLVVVPTLAGAWLGRKLDAAFGTGIMLSAALLSLGLAVGCALAWGMLRRAGGPP